MTLSMKGAAVMLAALVSVAPIAAAAETMPVGLQNAVPALGTTTQSNNILLAMLASPGPLGGNSGPLSNGLMNICHRSAGGCDGDGSSGGGSGGGSSPSTLKFPSPRGTVIFEHQWSSGDIPSSWGTPGAGKAGTPFAGKKFRLGGRPDGRFKIITDPETGAKVVDILVTRQDEARTRTHHTEIEINNVSEWYKGRFMVPGRRYLLEIWRKNINYRADRKWEIWWQNHSLYDNSTEKGRNPLLSLGGDRKGNLNLLVRADTKSTTYKKDGLWVYTRNSSYRLGSPESSAWTLWQMEIKVDPRNGALHLWKNGKLIHSEENSPVGYNDRHGPPWAFGWYKYFSGSNVDSRQAYIGPIRIQRL